jgi:hypothetical protein
MTRETASIHSRLREQSVARPGACLGARRGMTGRPFQKARRCVSRNLVHLSSARVLSHSIQNRLGMEDQLITFGQQNRIGAMHLLGDVGGLFGCGDSKLSKDQHQIMKILWSPHSHLHGKQVSG